MKRRNRLWREENWEEIINSYESSGLNKTEYCEKLGISRSYFYAHYQAIKYSQESRQSKIHESDFIPIRLREKEERTLERIKSNFTVESTRGTKVKFGEGCDLMELTQILEVLENAI